MIETATIEVRLAKPIDLKTTIWDVSTQKNKEILIIGQPYLLKQASGNWEGWYILTEDTDPLDIASWLEAKKMYVAVRPLEKK